MTFTEGLLAMVAADMKRHGRSQRAMAALLGVDHSALSLWLRGERVPGGDSVDRIVEYYGDEMGGGMVLRPYSGPMQSGSTNSVPWCSICAGWHIPGAGPCTATYSLGALSA